MSLHMLRVILQKLTLVIILVNPQFLFVMSRRILVSFSRREGTMKVVLEKDICKSPTLLASVLAEKFDLLISKFTIEVFNDESSRYEPVSDEQLSKINQYSPLRILIVEHREEDALTRRLEIEGKLFTTHGFTIGTHNVVVGEEAKASLGTGLVTWDCSMILAKYLEINAAEIVRGKTILELGAGTGLAGISAYILGARRVLLTDLEYALDNLRRNVALNIPAVGSRSLRIDVKDDHSSSIEVRSLDWTDPSTYCFPSNTDACSDNGINNAWDVVIGADIVWLEHLIPSLVHTLVAVTHSSTLVLLAHQTRTSRADAVLFDLLDEHFTVVELSQEHYHPLFVTKKIRIFQVVKRKPTTKDVQEYP